MSDDLLEFEDDIVPAYLLERSNTLPSDEIKLIKYLRDNPDMFDEISEKLREFCNQD